MCARRSWGRTLRTTRSPRTTRSLRIGTTVEAGGSAYTANEVRDPARSKIFGPGIGQRLVAVDVTQVGITAGDSYDQFDFFLQDADGQAYNSKRWVYSRVGYTAIEPGFGSGELAAGQRVRGWVTFSVPEVAVLVSVLVEAEGSGPRTLIADIPAGQSPVAPAPTPTLGPNTTHHRAGEAGEVPSGAGDRGLRRRVGIHLR